MNWPKGIAWFPAGLSILLMSAQCTPAAAEPATAGAAATAVAPGPETTPADSVRYALPIEILVTAPRQSLPLKLNPAATTVVGREVLRKQPRGVEPSDALALVPGVRVDNQCRGTLVHLSIRGQGILSESGIRGIRFLLDGLPLNDPSGVAPDLLDVDWSIADHLEVLRGPSGALYGGGGSGGVVVISTLDGPANPVGGGVSATGGSYGFWKTLARVGGTSENVNYSVSVSRSRDDGFRVHSAYDANNVYQKLRWTPSPKLRLTQVLSWADHHDGNPEGLNKAQVAQDPRQPNPDALTYDEFFQTNRLSTGLTGRFEIAPGQDVQAAAYYRTTQYKESVPSSVLHRTLYTPGASAQYNLNSAFPGGKNHLSAGADLQWQNLDEYRLKNMKYAAEDTLLSNQNMRQRGTGFFLLDRVEIGKYWGIMLGVRYDAFHNELNDRMAGNPVDLSGQKDFHRGTGRVGVSYAPRRDLNLYANWGQGFLPPSTKELASNPDHLGGFNTSLVTATSEAEEIGARGVLTSILSYNVAVFHLTTDNDFDRYRISSRPLETFYFNVGPSRRNGVETQVHVEPVRQFSADLAYTWSDFRYTAPAATIKSEPLDGKWLPNCPRHQLAVDCEYRPVEGLSLGISTQIESRWQVDSQNTATTSGITLWGARAAYARNVGGVKWTASVTGRNLLDRLYMGFTEPDPDGNSYHPGPGREVFGGIGVEF